MIPGTRVRIHYPGDVKHNAIGTVVSIRKVGSMKEHTVNLEKPLRISGFKPITRIYVTASRLRKLADAPKEQPQVVWQGEPPKPKRATVSKKRAQPLTVVVPQVTRVRIDDAITMAKAGTILDVNRQTIRNMIARGELHGEQHGKRNTWYVSQAAVERLAETYQDGRLVRKPRHSRGVKA